LKFFDILMNLYTELILDHYQNPRNWGTLSKDSYFVKVTNPLCGDYIEMQAKFKNDKLREIKFKGQGCVVSRASASMLTEYALGKRKNQLKKIDKKIMIKLLGIELGVNRIKCGLLPLEALKKLLILAK